MDLTADLKIIGLKIGVCGLSVPVPPKPGKLTFLWGLKIYYAENCVNSFSTNKSYKSNFNNVKSYAVVNILLFR